MSFDGWLPSPDSELEGLAEADQMLLNFIEAEADRRGAQATRYLDPLVWPLRRAEVRRRLCRSLGLHPRPAQSPLNVEHTGELERDGYRIEKITFEPRPGFVAPGMVYVPDPPHAQAPAVLYSVGHWMRNGKAEPLVQACCAALARLGFIAFVFDPIGQGERHASFADHGHKELALVGLSQEGLMTWEHVRAIDYLVSRPDVDARRVGMTGASGGGLSTVYTSAIDDRVSVAVPVCYVIALRQMLRVMRGSNWNSAGDLCNQVPAVIEFAEMAGVCGLIAPRPLLLINGQRDPQFPVAAAEEVLALTRPVYDAFDGTRLRLHLVDAGHGYDQEMRQAAYGWFLKWLQGLGDGSPVQEPTIATLPPEAPDLRCFGTVRPARGGRPIRNVVRARASALGLARNMSGLGATSEEEVRRILGWPEDAVPRAQVVHQSSSERDHRRIERHVITTENGISIPGYLFEGDGVATDYVVYIGDEGKRDGRALGLAERLLDAGTGTLAVDLRGLGETYPSPPSIMTLATLDGTIEEVPAPPGEHLEFETWSDSLMLGRSLLGQRVFDTIGAATYLRSIRPGCGISLIGSGPAASLTALFTAAMHTAFDVIVLDRLLVSFTDLIYDSDARFPLVAYVFGVLESFDIPDVAGLLGPHAVAIVNPIGSRTEDAPVAEARRAFGLAAARLSAEGGVLRIVSGDTADNYLMLRRRADWASSA